MRFTKRATRQLLAQIEWLSERSPGAAWNARDQIFEMVSLLGDYPRAAPLADEVHREAQVRFGRDGFIVRYRIEADDLIVVGLFHGRQLR